MPRIVAAAAPPGTRATDVARYESCDQRQLTNARRLGWAGTDPTKLLLSSERPKVSLAKKRPIYTGEQIEATIAVAPEPFRTMFTVAALTGARITPGEF